MTVQEKMLDIDNRRGHIADELADMTDGEVAEVTVVDGEEFDHREWMEAEMIETSRALEEYQKVITA